MWGSSIVYQLIFCYMYYLEVIHVSARKETFNNLNVLEMGPLRFRKGELKVTFPRPSQLKGHPYER